MADLEDAPEVETPSPPPRSSLLFAMGKLTAEVKGLQDAQGRQREAIEDLPAAITAALSPRFLPLEALIPRMDLLEKSHERTKWLVVGGGAVVLWAFKVLPDVIPLFTPKGPHV